MRLCRVGKCIVCSLLQEVRYPPSYPAVGLAVVRLEVCDWLSPSGVDLSVSMVIFRSDYNFWSDCANEYLRGHVWGGKIFLENSSCRLELRNFLEYAVVSLARDDC